MNIFRRSTHKRERFGDADLKADLWGRTYIDESGNTVRAYHAVVNHMNINLHPETASLLADIAAHLQERIKGFQMTDEVKRLRPMRRLTVAGLVQPPEITITTDEDAEEDHDGSLSASLFEAIHSLELNAIQVAWRLDGATQSPKQVVEDLVLSIQKIDLSTKREGSAILKIADLQMQMTPSNMEGNARSANSALMPEVVFKAAYVSTKTDRRFAFQAAGKALDLRLTSDLIVPIAALRDSLMAASEDLAEGVAMWKPDPATTTTIPKRGMFGKKYLASLLVDADFAGAVVTIQARKDEPMRESAFGMLKGAKRSKAGRFSRAAQGDDASQATLRAPGVAMKIEYSDNGSEDPGLNAEVKVAASSNVLDPSVVPLILEISSSVKEMMGKTSKNATKPSSPRKSEDPEAVASQSMVPSDPVKFMGRYKLNLGLWVNEQEFTLSCQPFARVAATARFDNIFLAVNTVQASDQERFFALSLLFSNFRAKIQHSYSRDPNASFELDSMVLSLMNSRHVSDTPGISAILNISPMKTYINAKQLQDFLLFREIWYPAELRQSVPAETVPADDHELVIQRYQQVAAESLPWDAVVSIEELVVQLDLGQSLGKSVFNISKLWASSKKASNLEQNLCIGFEKTGIESKGRMSGFIELQDFRVRTSISWPHEKEMIAQTPLVQASFSVGQCLVKAAFDYQPFAIAEISRIDFLMYNVRDGQGGRDRLVGNLEGDSVQAFVTTASASQAFGLYQAVDRIIQEKRVAFETALKELDGFLQRKSLFPSSAWASQSNVAVDQARTEIGPASSNDNPARLFALQTDVVVKLKAVNVGAFPSSFFDNQIFKVEAKDAQARFAVSAKSVQTYSSLALTLGELRVALASVSRASPQRLVDVSVSDVVTRAGSARGGTILKVPKLVAAMETWQPVSSNTIDYVFNSTFQGKVDVGWNYSRISFIRKMWETHSSALAGRMGKPLPKSAVQITGVPKEGEKGEMTGDEEITSVIVNVPQSRFNYHALRPPVIETPQLRDMGEATPPLEWIGLQRDKLPNLTHQIITVPLLELAKEAEDAYARILGASRPSR